MRFLGLTALAAALTTAIFSSTGSAGAKTPTPPTTGGIVIHMNEQNGSGIDGRAEIFPADGGTNTLVQVFINEVEPGGSYPAMLHLQGCGSLLEVHLNPAVALAGVTTARSVTTVDRPFSEVANGKHFVDVYDRDVHGGAGQLISCGQIPAQPRPPEVLPPSGAGPGGPGGPGGNAAALGVLLVVGTAIAGAGAALRRSRSHKE
ncbi:MAG: hypothetical protein HY873_02590 [Chloroflexi bacterium]|nr:hypothetical protein [Chloroflexota bacterium]